MNDAILDLLNGRIVGRSDLVDDQIVLWAKYAIFVLVLVAGAKGATQLLKQPRESLWLAGTVIAGAVLALVVVMALASQIFEARPFVSDSDTIQLLSHGPDNSFPSDHATLAGLVAIIGSLAWPRWTIPLVALALAVGISRVMAGVHYPGDVLAGWAVGAGAGAVAWACLKGRSRRAPERATNPAAPH